MGNMPTTKTLIATIFYTLVMLFSQYCYANSNTDAENRETTWDNDVPQALCTYGDYLYVGTKNGVFKIKDHDEHWTEISNGLVLVNGYVRALCQHNGSLYVGTGDGVFKLNDTEKSWTQINNGLPLNEPLQAIYVYTLCSYDGYLYVITSDGIFKTNDDGKAWIPANDGLSLLIDHSWITAYDLCSYNGNLYLATLGNGIFKINRSGASWEKVNNFKDSSYVRKLYSDNNWLYAVTPIGIFKTNDEINWVSIYTAPMHTPFDSSILDVANIRSLFSHDGYLYALDGHSIFRTKINDEKKWTKIESGLTSEASAFLYSSNDDLYAVTGDGVFKLIEQKSRQKHTECVLLVLYKSENYSTVRLTNTVL
jgi:hypothetical protein